MQIKNQYIAPLKNRTSPRGDLKFDAHKFARGRAERASRACQKWAVTTGSRKVAF